MIEEQIETAEHLFSQGEIEAARRRLEALLKENPFNPLLLNDLGIIARDAGDLAVAEAYFLRAFDNEPENSEVLFNLFYLLFERLKKATALGVLIHIFNLKNPNVQDSQEFEKALQVFCQEIVQSIVNRPEFKLCPDDRISHQDTLYANLLKNACVVHQLKKRHSTHALLEALHTLVHHQNAGKALQILIRANKDHLLNLPGKYLLISLFILQAEFQQARCFIQKINPTSFWTPTHQALFTKLS